MANPVGKVGFKLVTIAVSIPVGILARKGVQKIWHAARPQDPPTSPAEPGVELGRRARLGRPVGRRHRRGRADHAEGRGRGVAGAHRHRAAGQARGRSSRPELRRPRGAGGDRVEDVVLARDHLGRADRAHQFVEDQRAGAITSTRPGCITGIAARSAWVIAQQPVGQLVDCRPRHDRAVNRGRLVALSPSDDRGHRGDRAGDADERSSRVSSGTSIAASSIAATMSARAASICAAVGGSSRRCRSVSRTQPMSMLSDCNARDRRRHRAPARSSRRRCRPPAAAWSDRAEATGGAGEGQRRLVVAADHLGLDPSTRMHHRRRSRRGWRRRGSRSSPPSAPASTPNAAIRRGVFDQRDPGALDRGRVEAAGAVDPWHRAARSASRGPGRQRPSAVDRRRSSSRTELVPQSMPATTHGPSVHHGGSSASASSPSGLTPGPDGQAVRDQHVQALHPVRHAAGADAGDLRRRGRSIRGGPGRPRARPGSARPARGRRAAARSSRASARTPRAARSPTPPAGRSGSTASGTGCRRRSRGEVSTTSGLPHGQRCATARIARGARPSWVGDDGPIGLGQLSADGRAHGEWSADSQAAPEPLVPGVAGDRGASRCSCRRWCRCSTADPARTT